MIKEIYKTKKYIRLCISDDKMNNLIDMIKEYHSDNILDIKIQDEYKIYVKLKTKLKSNTWDNYMLFDDIIKDWLGAKNNGPVTYLLYDLCIISDNECIIEV